MYGFGQERHDLRWEIGLILRDKTNFVSLGGLERRDLELPITCILNLEFLLCDCRLDQGEVLYLE
jgi:hypothetical protein